MPPKHLNDDDDDHEMHVVGEDEKQLEARPEVDETQGQVTGVASVTKAFRMRECPVCKVGTCYYLMTESIYIPLNISSWGLLESFMFSVFNLNSGL